MRPLNRTKEKAAALAAVFYPPRCPLCRDVLPDGRWYAHPQCLAKTTYLTADDAMRAGREESFAGCMVVWEYKGALRRALYGLKYKNKREYARMFALEALRVYGKTLLSLPIAAVVPIPLSGKRKRVRGYNQAACIARILAQTLALPCEETLLRRVKETTPLLAQSAGERMHTLRHAFLASPDVRRFPCILLVDDICTTGSTFDEAARTLRSAGVTRVYCIAMAGRKTEEKDGKGGCAVRSLLL